VTLSATTSIPSRIWSALPILVLLAAGGALLTALAPAAWLVLLADGPLALAALVSAWGWGSWPAIWLGLHRRPMTQLVCIAVALGLGVLAVGVLVLGVAGWLSGAAAWGLTVAGWALGCLGLCRSAAGGGAVRPVRPELGCPGPDPASSTAAGGACVTGRRVMPILAGIGVRLVLAWPLTVLLFGASLPPGILWTAEAHGYDVLEYHLQVPREYFDLRRITFLPHNAYASFPQQMEVLYLLLMHLVGSPLAAAIPAQLLHAGCAVLTVVALAAWTPAGWPRRFVAAVAGSVPWLAYLGCLAYVELGMLFFAAVAAGLIVDQLAPHPKASAAGGSTSIPAGWRTGLAAGLCAGLAAGCKYTGAVLVGATLATAWLCTMPGSVAARLRPIACFIAGAGLAMSPWLIRNAAFTGNPVYPFAYEWFGGSAWSREQAAQWSDDHSLPDQSDSGGGSSTTAGRRLLLRLRLTGRELLGSCMLGPGLVILALMGFLRRTDRVAVALLLWAALIVAAWAAFTHMPGRFAVPIVVPLSLLAGRAVDPRLRRSWTVLVACVALGGALGGNAVLAKLLHAENAWWSRFGTPLRALVGATERIPDELPLNRMLSPDARVWLVGEARVFYLRPRVHYTVVYSRDPWLEYARQAGPEQCVAWLRTRNVSHVVFCWAEIDRLRRTSGFHPLVTREWVGSLAAAGLRPVPFPRGLADADLGVYEVQPE